MMPDIRYLARPQNVGQSVDFIEIAKQGLVLPTSREVNTSMLCSSEGQGDRYGQWGVYVIRLLPDDFPATGSPAFVTDLNIWVGGGNVGADTQVSDVVVRNQSAGLLGFDQRGLACAVSGDQVRVSLKWQFLDSNTLPNNGPDQVIAWISPGAPQYYRVPFESSLCDPANPLNSRPALKIPVFAQSMTFTRNVQKSSPVWAGFTRWRDVATPPTGAFYGDPLSWSSATAMQPGNSSVPVPPSARFVSFFEDPSEPYDINVPGFAGGWFDCWG